MNEVVNWPRPAINPLPEMVYGLEMPKLGLNDEKWKVNVSPSEQMSFTGMDTSNWMQVKVPGEVRAEGGKRVYLRLLQIPAEWAGNRVFLRFDGANCYTRVFVDGMYLCDHYGGFVSWDCELTLYVRCGDTHCLAVEVEDRPKDVNPFHWGGLIRDITLYAVPKTFLKRLQADTAFDATYKNATLTVLAMLGGNKGEIALELIDPHGKRMVLGTLTGQADSDVTGNYAVDEPIKWDSEHPYLYTLLASVMKDGMCVERCTKKFGFRQIDRRNDEVFINGDLLKLRGVNRHDIHPLTGRTVTHELVEADIRLFKEANINFIRTSHYPPRPDFLDLCDQYGIYVEDEIAVSFLGFSANRTESDPDYTACYMGQFSEMVERDRSHPCVIIWSLANESYWGKNHALMNEYAHRETPNHLTIFSYPMTQMEDDLPTDLWSAHYDRWDMKLNEMSETFRRSLSFAPPHPVLHDESIHTACYNKDELKRDPGVSDFWGETIYRFWDRLWEAKGTLGCAIWAGIDDVRVDGTGTSGYQWGLIDGWRRPKPEYWHARKGYSPIKLLGQPSANGDGILIPIRNRFNHTNLKEVLVKWRLCGALGEMYGPDVAARSDGKLIIPSSFVPGQMLELTFMDAFGYCVDEENLILNKPEPKLPALTGGAPHMEWEDDTLKVSGKAFELLFSRKTGLIELGTFAGKTILTGGPRLNLIGLPLAPWALEQMDAFEKDSYTQISLLGNYGRVKVRFIIRIDTDGLMETTYTIVDMPYPSPRKIAVTSSITSHIGGYSEVGVSFDVAANLGMLSWERNNGWSIYPDWHIARKIGDTPRFNPIGANLPDQRPDWDWRMDEMDWALFGKYDFGKRGTRDFASMKPSILRASLTDGAVGFSALSNGQDAVRMEVLYRTENIISSQNPKVKYEGRWIKLENNYRSIDGVEMCSNRTGDFCEYTFEGSGIAWISSLDHMCGTANVYIDGNLMAKNIDLGMGAVGKNARGLIKHFRQISFSTQELPLGEHTIHVEVTGEKAKNAHNSYVNIDHFVVLDGHEVGDTRFIINNEYNYPELSWGTYSKPPILVETGYTGCLYTKLGK